MDFTRFPEHCAMFTIEEWGPYMGGGYQTIIAGRDLVAMTAAWNALQGGYPEAKLLMRQGAMVMKKRAALGG